MMLQVLLQKRVQFLALDSQEETQVSAEKLTMELANQIHKQAQTSTG